jgi:hypothetical protein
MYHQTLIKMYHQALQEIVPAEFRAAEVVGAFWEDKRGTTGSLELSPSYTTSYF